MRKRYKFATSWLYTYCGAKENHINDTVNNTIVKQKYKILKTRHTYNEPHIYKKKQGLKMNILH
jgi:hypothetical protein